LLIVGEIVRALEFIELLAIWSLIGAVTMSNVVVLFCRLNEAGLTAARAL
jgi:hypothetical protein